MDETVVFTRDDATKPLRKIPMSSRGTWPKAVRVSEDHLPSHRNFLREDSSSPTTATTTVTRVVESHKHFPRIDARKGRHGTHPSHVRRWQEREVVAQFRGARLGSRVRGAEDSVV